jgi:hypothetical protein
LWKGWGEGGGPGGTGEVRAFKVKPMHERFGDFGKYLAEPFGQAEAFAARRSAETAGRPLGGKDWLVKLEEATGRRSMRIKPGPKVL